TMLHSFPTRRSSDLAKFQADWVLSILGVFIALGVWELLSRTEVLRSDYIPPASEVLLRIVELSGTAAFWLNVWGTLESVLLGLLVVLVLAPVLALLIGLVPAFRESVWFLTEFLKPIPPIVLILLDRKSTRLN